MIKPGTPPERSRRPEQKPAAAPASLPPSTGALPATAAPEGADDAPRKTTTPKPPAKPRPPAKHPQSARTEHQAPPLSSGAQTGEEPLRTFGQLKQFWNKKSP
ncbi:MAG TPA: hypothetical protein VGM05_08995, partial [Planctomycetaceae bacterium]